MIELALLAGGITVGIALIAKALSSPPQPRRGDTVGMSAEQAYREYGPFANNQRGRLNAENYSTEGCVHVEYGAAGAICTPMRNQRLTGSNIHVQQAQHTGYGWTQGQEHAYQQARANAERDYRQNEIDRQSLEEASRRHWDGWSQHYEQPARREEWSAPAPQSRPSWEQQQPPEQPAPRHNGYERPVNGGNSNPWYPGGYTPPDGERTPNRREEQSISDQVAEWLNSGVRDEPW